MPVPTITKPTIVYWKMGGRAKPGRMMAHLAFGTDGFENFHDFDFKDEKELLKKGEKDCLLAGTTGSLPHLRIPAAMTGSGSGSDAVMCQSHAIARWCAGHIKDEKLRKQIYPRGTDPADVFKAAIMDECIATSDDLLTKCPQDPDEEVKKKKREEYSAPGAFMHNACTQLEHRLTTLNTGGPLLFGSDGLCLADLFICGITEMVQKGWFDHVPASYMDQFPAMCAQNEAVKADALVKAYDEAFPGL